MRWWSEHLQIVATSRLFPIYTYAWFVMWILSRFLLVTYRYWCQHMYMVGLLPHFLFTISNLLNCYIVHCREYCNFFCERGVGVGVGYGVSKVIFRQKTKCLKKLLNTTLVYIFLVLLNRILSTIQYWCQGYQHCSL